MVGHLEVGPWPRGSQRVPGVDHTAKAGGMYPPGAIGFLHDQNGHESSSSSPASSATTSTGVVSSSSPHPISCVVACTDSAALAVVAGSGSKSSSSDALPINRKSGVS